MALPLEKDSLAPEFDAHVEDFVVWRNPRGNEGTLALLTSERLIFADPGTPGEIEAAIDRFRADGSLPQGCEIDAESISTIRFDKRSTDIAILYSRSDRERAIHYYDFGNPTARDSFVEAFKAAFGDRFVDRTREHTPLTAALRPLLVGTLVAVGTWALQSIAAELVSPTGIVLVGGCGLALTLATLVRRVAHPPILRTLTQRA